METCRQKASIRPIAEKQSSDESSDSEDQSSNVNNAENFDDFSENEKSNRQSIAQLRLSTFDVWQYEHKQLIQYIIAMFKDLHILDALGITVSRLRDWLLAVEQNYRNVQFHNFRHAFCVTQMMYFMVCELNLLQKMSTLQIGILLVACICHDLDHPGLSNLYHQKAHTELSVLYKNKSVLEHHHCAIAFQILAVNDLNIFLNLSKGQFSEASHIIIQLILATDMAIHNQICDQFNVIVKSGFNISDPEHMMSLQKILIKCCDISNEVRPLSYSEPWVDFLFEEFFSQADRERREGLSVANFMKRSQVHKAADQLKFIRGIILPLFTCLGKVFPDVNTKILHSLQQSIQYYEKMSTFDADETKDAPPANATAKKGVQEDARNKSGNLTLSSVLTIPKIVVTQHGSANNRKIMH
uniref:High affinity cGMP-specific 3',5'-cyclic phosphodiesterase 9A n=1 Tax=Ciona savignyi TaxID=51511 RepID=H2YGD4_CIOSA